MLLLLLLLMSLRLRRPASRPESAGQSSRQPLLINTAIITDADARQP